MLIEVLGVVRDVDPVEASLDESIVRALRRWGPSYQRDLWYRSSAQCGTRESFQASLDRLVERGVIVRSATSRRNSWLFRMAPDQRRRERAKKRQEAAVKPLTPASV